MRPTGASPGHRTYPQRLTERPAFDVDGYARESEQRLRASRPSWRPTAPPPAEHVSLCDSCRDLPAAEGGVEERADGRADGRALLTSRPTLGAVAVPLASPEDFAWFDFGDHGRAVIEAVDDRRTVEEILLATETPLSDGLLVFGELARQGLVAFRSR